MKKIILAFILLFMLHNCNSQNKTDLKEINLQEKIEAFIGKNSKAEKEKEELVTKLPTYSFYNQQIDNFKFGDISFEKSENSYVKILVNNLSDSKILGFMINEKDNPALAEKLQSYLVNQYGKPKIIEEEPTLKKDNIILGNSTSSWIDNQKGCTIYFYKNYFKSNGKQGIGFSLDMISNSAEYPKQLSDALQTKKIIDWYNTRF